ncbi:hypothetical protein AMEX_G10174 [Astyanax mexicanus]|uniref:Uncharacterized protein n=1 Tax=Astyanax mexicanus TaxID=7994 RepID=A0A8T2LTN2_ASTMX|nr:hypothetical protein AMEX_G10174 [Astyanax mexicanus]
MPATQSESTGTGPPRLYVLFRFYDPEVIAVLTILVGLFQVILAFPAYYLSIDVTFLYWCPICVGAMHVTGGSLAFVCERSPSKKMLKNCLYSTLCGLFLGFCAIILYGFSANSILSLETCTPQDLQRSSECPRDAFVDFFRHYVLLMGIYAVAAIFLQSFLSISAIKALRLN